MSADPVGPLTGGRRLSRGTVTSAFLRSFLIQASWNYHNMIGNGFAFAMLPALRRLFGHDDEEMAAAVRRHMDHFNAHPYLSNLAVGAALRLEADGTDAETVRRFKTAVRGPLGGLGDSLVWATWLPAVSMLALALWWLGVTWWVVISVFLLLYNAGHLWLRVWAFRSGLTVGRDVARALGHADLTGWSERLKAVAVLLLGLLVGAALAGEAGLAGAGALWTGIAAGAFVVGDVVGHRAWRPAAVTVVAAVAAVSAWGVVQ